MRNRIRNESVEEALRDLERHTLAGIRGEIAQLVYLASTRDYNTGEYYHDGLAFRFNEETARAALAAHHRRIFQELASSSLEELVHHLNIYINSSCLPEAGFVKLWKKLEPYRITIPLDCDSLSVELFFSNIKTALAVLQARREQHPGS